MIQHVSLEVRREDADALVRFVELLGFAEVQPPEGLAGATRWAQGAGTQVHLLLTEDPVVPSRAHFAVVAADYRSTLRALREGGFEPQARQEHWGAARSFVRGPAGHLVEVMAAPPA